MEKRRHVYAIRIYLENGYQPMAEIAFGDGGRPNGETKIIPWDELEVRNEYIINAYTFVWDERINKSFNEYIGR